MNLTIEADTEYDLLYIALSEKALKDKSVKKTRRINDDIALDFDADGRLLGIEVLNASKNIGEPIDDVRLDFLIGVKEAAALAGVHRSNFIRDYADKPGFPPPVATLATGRIWLRSQVEHHLRTSKRRRPSSTRRAV